MKNFQTPLPLASGETLIIGIAGAWERWDEDGRLPRRVCAELRKQGARCETVENHKLKMAKKLLLRALDRDRNGKLNDAERASANVILFGHSLGGAASVRLCRWLERERIPVRLNVQIDSVGFLDAKIPANVRAAANLYQHDLGPIRGRDKIYAANAARTTILGNWRYEYPASKQVPIEQEPLARRIFMNSHLKMEADPEVWAHVERLILDALNQ